MSTTDADRRVVSSPSLEVVDLGTLPPLGEVPTRMLAQVVRPERYGDPAEAFRPELVPTPAIGPDEVLIYVMASGINYNNVWAALGTPLDVIAERQRLGEPEADIAALTQAVVDRALHQRPDRLDPFLRTRGVDEVRRSAEDIGGRHGGSDPLLRRSALGKHGKGGQTGLIRPKLPGRGFEDLRRFGLGYVEIIARAPALDRVPAILLDLNPRLAPTHRLGARGDERGGQQARNRNRTGQGLAHDRLLRTGAVR